jgi:hypothetical protein
MRRHLNQLPNELLLLSGAVAYFVVGVALVFFAETTSVIPFAMIAVGAALVVISFNDRGRGGTAR